MPQKWKNVSSSSRSTTLKKKKSFKGYSKKRRSAPKLTKLVQNAIRDSTTNNWCLQKHVAGELSYSGYQLLQWNIHGGQSSSAPQIPKTAPHTITWWSSYHHWAEMTQHMLYFWKGGDSMITNMMFQSVILVVRWSSNRPIDSAQFVFSNLTPFYLSFAQLSSSCDVLDGLIKNLTRHITELLIHREKVQLINLCLSKQGYYSVQFKNGFCVSSSSI